MVVVDCSYSHVNNLAIGSKVFGESCRGKIPSFELEFWVLKPVNLVAILLELHAVDVNVGVVRAECGWELTVRKDLASVYLDDEVIRVKQEPNDLYGTSSRSNHVEALVVEPFFELELCPVLLQLLIIPLERICGDTVGNEAIQSFNISAVFHLQVADEVAWSLSAWVAELSHSRARDS